MSNHNSVGPAENIRIGCESIIGARESQQDSYRFESSPEGTIAVVCDGMGGMDDGGKASRTAVQDLCDAYLNKPKDQPIPDFFRSQAQNISRKICGFRNAMGKKMNSGTTMVAVVIENEKLWWLSVGDSRIYLTRGAEIRQVNREHNYRMMLKEQLSAGEITQSVYNAEEKTRKAEALISYLGIQELTLMEINSTPFTMYPGDRVLLCSDGVYRSLNDQQIHALAEDNDIDPTIAAKRICQMAQRYGGRGQDNTTMLILKYLKR